MTQNTSGGNLRSEIIKTLNDGCVKCQTEAGTVILTLPERLVADD